MAAISSTCIITPSTWEEIQQKYPDFMPFLPELQQQSGVGLSEATISLINNIVLTSFSCLKNATDAAMKKEKLKHNKDIKDRTATLEHEKTELKIQIKQLIESVQEQLKAFSTLKKQLEEKNDEFAQLDKIHKETQEQLKEASEKVQKAAETVQALVDEMGTFQKLGKEIDDLLENLEAKSIRALTFAKATKKEIEESLEQTKLTFEKAVETALFAAVFIPAAIYLTYSRLTDWRQFSPKAKFEGLCNSAGFQRYQGPWLGEKKDHLYKNYRPIHTDNSFTGISCDITRPPTENMFYPISELNYFLRKYDSELSCTFLNVKTRNYGNQSLPTDCHSLEILSSTEFHNHHEILSLLKPNRFYFNPKFSTLIRDTSYFSYTLCLQHVKELYVLVRPKHPIAPAKDAVIKKIYRNPFVYEDGHGRNESWRGVDSSETNIGNNYELTDSNTIYMYSAVFFYDDKCSQPYVCELAISCELEVIGFIIHRNLKNKYHSVGFHKPMSDPPKDYFNWEVINPEHRYKCLAQLLKTTDFIDFRYEFNRYFTTYQYITDSHPNITVNENTQWNGRYYPTLELTIKNIEKIFLVLKKEKEYNWLGQAEAHSVKMTILTTTNENETQTTTTNHIDEIQLSEVLIYDLANFVQSLTKSYTISLHLESKYKIAGLIIQ